MMIKETQAISTESLISSTSQHFLAELGQKVFDCVHYASVGIFDKHGDPRVANYPLMRTPWPVIALTILYYWFVRSFGPSLMKNRKPFQILPIVRCYSLAMTLWNGFGFYIAMSIMNNGLDCLGCQPVDPFDRSEKKLTQIYYGYMFLTSRLVEFADTIFFTLRKKDNQVSSFHVFHHSSVPTTVWFFIKFAPGGNSGIFPLINTAIHTVMYTYYLLATYPAAKPYLFWKKYLTLAQIIQFFIIISVCAQPLFIPGCQFPRVLLLVTIGFSIVFIGLFVDFYIKSYKPTTTTTNITKISKNINNNNISSHQDKNNNVKCKTN